MIISKWNRKHKKICRRKGWRSMDIRQEKFNKENKPFYMVDHEDGIYMNYIEIVEQI